MAPFNALYEASRTGSLAMLHSGQRGPALLFTEPQAELLLPAQDWPHAWTALQDFLAQHQGQRCVGYLAYDLRDAVEAIPRRIPEDFPMPCLHFVVYDRVQQWSAAAVPPPPSSIPAQNLRAHCSRQEYEAKVQQVVEHICAGDIFQANLTQPFTADYLGDPRLLFWRLCYESPAPFAAYMETSPNQAVLCSSPEEFLHVEGDLVRTKPIKGTRPRSNDAAADQALLQELLASEKDQAELAMIVDLLRNDLGKVAVPGSVQVGPFPEHESFAQVHHTFATVTARLRPDVSLVDLLRATFPCGSITGAPKLRCMEILEELELVRRGLYTGAVGSIGPGRAMHLNVAIRTMLYRQGKIRFNVGGGITADSQPALEYEETLHKAEGMLRALGTELQIP